MELHGGSTDYLAEYDFFANRQKEELAKKLEVKRIQDAARREAKREQALAWRHEGKQALDSVRNRVKEIKFRLEPHHHYRLTMEMIHNLFDRSLALDCKPGPYSTRTAKMLYLLRQDRSSRRFRQQVNLVECKFAIHKELLAKLRSQSPYHAQFWYVQLKPPLKVVRVLFRYWAQFVRVEIAQRRILYKRREIHRKAVAKLDLIHRTQAACAYIPQCKSIQHYHPKGCGHCGVIFMGGTLSGAVPYVKSISRDTGVPTLVTLEFEIETLHQEEMVQIGIVEQASRELQAIEEVIFMEVRLALQRWWAFVLAFKRYSRRHVRFNKSYRRHRRRRMITMKRELDQRIRQPEPLAIAEYYNKYCDIPAALAEQITALNDRKHQRLQRVAQLFRSKLHRLVAEGRERRYQEWLRLQSIPPPEKPIVIRQLPAIKDGARLVCYRPRCNLRKFLTKERYDIHMSIHRCEDEEKKRVHAQHAAMGRKRAEEESRFLAILSDYRTQLTVDEDAQASLEVIAMDEPATASSEQLTAAAATQLVPEESRGDDREDILCQTCSPAPWLTLPHRYHLTRLHHAQQFHLELISRAVGVSVPSRVDILPNSITRIGRATTNECVISAEHSSNGEALMERIEAIHCLIHYRTERPEEDSAPSALYIVDNHSAWGTYILSKGTTAIKVPSQGRGRGSYLTNGALICIAAKPKGESELSAVVASAACVVYRLQSHHAV